MAFICKCIGDWGCLKTDVDKNGGVPAKDVEAAIRNAKIKYAVAGVLTTLAALAVVLGALGFSGHLSGGAAIFAKNALWVTLAGSLAIALALIASVGHKCWSSHN